MHLHIKTVSRVPAFRSFSAISPIFETSAFLIFLLILLDEDLLMLISKLYRVGKMRKFKYQMLIQWSDEDNCFLVGFPDFPGQRFRTHGDTYEEAVANGAEALESLIMAYEATGQALPEPTVCKVAENG